MRRVLLACLVAICPSFVRGEDFCLYTTVEQGEQTTESTTIFRGGRVYDFLSAPREIAIFDPRGQRFILLDLDRQVRTVVTTDEIEKFSERLKSEAAARKVPLLDFLVKPTFTKSFDDATGQLSMSSPWMSYHVETVLPKAPEAAEQYAEFTDWQAKLNVLMTPGSLPPFPRLALNAELDRLGRIPQQVELTRYSQSIIRKPVSIQATHRVQWRLLDAELKRIDEADARLHTFREVKLAEYQQPAADENAVSSLNSGD